MDQSITRKTYEAPDLVVLGSFVELTKGNECGSSDGWETGDDECVS